MTDQFGAGRGRNTEGAGARKSRPTDPERAMQGALYQWTIYDHPSDYPTGWVVRRFAVRPNVAIGREATYHRTLDEARKVIPPGAYCIGRHPEDDPAIYEVWT